jgi:hypothetical protein
MPLTFTLGGRCCDKDAAKFYFNTLSSSVELLSEATPCPHLFARSYRPHLLCDSLTSLMAHAEFIS